MKMQLQPAAIWKGGHHIGETLHGDNASRLLPPSDDRYVCHFSQGSASGIGRKRGGSRAH